MLNAMWIAMLLTSVVCGALRHRLDEVAAASMQAAGGAVTLALGLVGATCFWLGLMRVLREAGLTHAIGRALRPAMRRLFGDVPADHPAMGLMILNITANMLGLGNAATPFGLKAMSELERINPRPGVASDAMVLFLAINTSGLAVLPTGMVALRASLGSKEPGAIFLPTLMSTLSAAVVGVVAAKWLARHPRYALANITLPNVSPASAESVAAGATAASPHEAPWPGESNRASIATRCQRRVGLVCTALVVGSLALALHDLATAGSKPIGLVAALRQAGAQWSLVLIIVAAVLAGLMRGVNVYHAMVEGGREGFDVALRIIPYLVAILTAVGMLRASGAVTWMVEALEPLTGLVGMPAAALPMALLRPLSGSGAYAIAADTMRAEGPDSLAGLIVSTMMGSTETTFYVLALYLGSARICRARHAVLACLAADVAGMLMATWSCRLVAGQVPA